MGKTYHSPEKTVQTAANAELRDPRRPRDRNIAKQAMASYVEVSRLNPMLLKWLHENGPKTPSGIIDLSVISIERDYHVTPDSDTVDSVIIYANPEQKRAADSQ